MGVIGPWNYPLTNSFGDCIPALAAGNAVVLKPSEITPLTSLLMAEMLTECGAAARRVRRDRPASGDAGAEMIDHVDFVMFTGSTATGKKVAERAARSLTPFGLELGGKDPMIILARRRPREGRQRRDLLRDAERRSDVHLGRARLCRGAGLRRVREAGHRQGGKLRQGVPPSPGKVDVGAVTVRTADRHRRVARNDAVEKGAKVAVGGHRRTGTGRFYEPTVLLDVDHSMECMTEETFGPTLPVMKVADADEALRLANDSALRAAGLGVDEGRERGEAIASRIEAGAANVNEHQVNYLALELPMGGWKGSGIGARHGADGIRKYTRRQASVVTRFGPKRELFMFPYSKRAVEGDRGGAEAAPRARQALIPGGCGR